MIDLDNPNPHNLFDIRRLDVPPAYFEYSNIVFNYNLEEAIVDWITKNMKGRFYVGRSLELLSDKNVDQCLKIGFENTKEASYFMLACPHLKYK